MQTGERGRAQDIYSRIFQLERRISMEWYSRDQLLDDFNNLRQIIHRSAKKHTEVNNQLKNYYHKIDLLVDQII